MTIHPTAIIDPSAQIADDVTVGAYSIIGADVELVRAAKLLLML
jgi:UDP-N-acetylglucosamine acyltransferase